MSEETSLIQDMAEEGREFVSIVIGLGLVGVFVGLLVVSEGMPPVRWAASHHDVLG